jgi:SAM-dependent methyltransferase
MTSPDEQASWESHWHTTAERPSLVGRIASAVRSQILSRAVRWYADAYFDAEGIFVECGCGTGQSSARVRRARRRLVALDFSPAALRQAGRVSVFTDRVQADIRRLPFRDASVRGIWNLGVMEHLDGESAVGVLSEFRRVLKPGGVAMLFWPPQFGSSRWVLAPVEWLLSRGRDHPYRVFPDEVNRIRSRAHAVETVRAAGLEPVATDFTIRDAFIHIVVVARRPGA